MKQHIVRTANRSLRRAQAEWNIEQEISNDEVWNRCTQSFSKIILIEYLTSKFVIPCSIFVIRFFRVYFFDLTGRPVFGRRQR
jgi:hypothetical protein